MAGLPWFELDVLFHEDPKVKALASRLREPLAEAYVSRLYAYCYRHAQDRFAPEVAADTIEDAVRWKGRRGVLFDALFASEVLEREAGKVVVHGVKARLGPHLAKRQSDAERQKRHREKAAKSIGRPSDVTTLVTGDVTCDIAGDSRRDTDKDKDTDKDTSETASQSEVELRLAGVRSKLASAFGRSKPLGVGKDAGKVAAAFSRWLDAVGEDFTVSECARVARDKGVAPSYLSWWPGWLDTATDSELQRWRDQGVA